MKNKLEYFICLFLYALKENNVSKNTLFRYVYIFDVVNEYFGNLDKINDEIIIDKDVGVGNLIELTDALNEIARRNYITIKGAFIYVETNLISYIDNIKNSEKVQEDLNKIMYFVGIVLSYSEDIILSAFFNEPNVENTISRGKNKIELSNNKLKNLLEEFEQQANNGRESKLDKYDVFSSWLDFVFEEYLQEKSNG